MRIAHVFKDFYPPLAAGITRYIADIADASAERGHHVEVHVAGVRHSRQDILPSGVVVHRHAELFRALAMPIAPGLVSEVRALDVDVLHVHLPNPIGELGSVMNGHASIICSFHAQLGRQKAIEPLYAPLRNRLLDRARCVLVSTDAMSQTPEMSAHGEKVRVLPYGVSPRLIAGDRVSARNDATTTELLFVGRLVYYKGLETMLRALATTGRAALTIVGDGPDRAGLELLTQQLDLAERVTFLGFLSDERLLEAYARSDVFILPSVSRAEAFGMAMSEAMANGIPAISTALGTGTDWVNLDGVTGLVVPPGDTAALARAIDRLADPERRAVLGAAARTRAGTEFSFERHANVIDDIYLSAAR